MNPERLAMLRFRARLYARIRHFFSERNVLEVHTPVLSAAGNTEPNIDGFETTFSGHIDAGVRTRYLRTSPEYPLKRLLAEGLGDCYELGRVFRNGEAGQHHNPEFSMLEWYRLGFNHLKLAEETIDLVQQMRQLAGQQRANVHTFTYQQLFVDKLNIDPWSASEQTLRAPLRRFNIDPSGLTRDDWLDLLMTHCIQSRFDKNVITVIRDWPATQCALAKIRPGPIPVAERFELYLGKYELANGYHELTDANEQRQRFIHENTRRQQQGDPVLPLDENLLDILDDLPPCAGVALGIERLLMCLENTDAIKDVMVFDFPNA